MHSSNENDANRQRPHCGACTNLTASSAPAMVRCWALMQGHSGEHVDAAWLALPTEVVKGRMDYLAIIALLVDVLESSSGAQDALSKVEDFVQSGNATAPLGTAARQSKDSESA